VAGAEHTGWRADRTLCALLPALNRRAAKTLFHACAVRLNGRIASGAERVADGDRFEFPDPAVSGPENLIARASAPRLTTPHGRHLVRLYEDEAVLVINKPAEIPVHRGQGGFTRRDTLEDVLKRAYPAPRPRATPRSGVQDDAAPDEDTHAQGFYLVHRLDMETSGCLLIAKTEQARDALVADFAARKVHKEYLALVVGEVPWRTLAVRKPISYVRASQPGGASWQLARRAKKPIMRGQKKGVALEEGDVSGKASETHFEVAARYKRFTLLRVLPKTGRTHQIRVHLQSIGHPLAYDPLYGRATPLRLREFRPHVGPTDDRGEEVVLNRLPLHAWKLRFAHPVTGAEVSLEAPLPRDLKDFIRLLKRHRT